MSNILESYLVSLGFSTDEPSFRKLQNVVTTSEHVVADNVSGMAKRVVEAQGTIVGAFLSISAGIVGLVDKVAMSDQAFRLQGLAALMSTDAMRRQSMILKALGVDLKEAIYDPETNARVKVLSHDYDQLMAGLDPVRFEKAMIGVRNIRMEFARLQMHVEFLGMKFSSDLYEKLFPNQAAVEKFSNWIDNFEKKIPQIANDLSDYAIPAIKGTWAIMKGLGEVVKEGAVAFTNIIGLLSGDESIQGTAFSFDKVAKAIEHVGEWMLKFEGWIVGAEKMLAKFATATTLLLHGKFSEAAAEYKSMLADLTPGSGLVAGAVAGAPVGTVVGGLVGGIAGGITAGPFGVVPGAVAGAAIGGGVAGPAIGGLAGMSAGLEKEDIEARKAFPDREVNPTFEAIREAIGTNTPKADVNPQFQAIRDSFKSALVTGVQGIRDWTLGKFGELGAAPLPPEKTATRPTAFATAPAPPPDLVTKIADAITNVEAGGKANPISVRQNNPGNLREWGNYPIKNGYVEFPDWATGMEALHKQIQKNIDRGLTLEQFFAGKEGAYKGFAPSADKNDPEAYARNVSKRIGVDVNVPLNQVGQAQPPWLGFVPAWITDSPAWYSIPPAWLGGGTQAGAAQYAAPAEAATKYLAQPAAVQNYLQRPTIGPEVQAAAPAGPTTVTIDVGGINIMQPNASAAEIGRATEKAIRNALNDQTQFDLASGLSPAW